MDTFEICWFRHDAHKASPWLQRSVVNLASPQECRGSSLLPKLVAKLFLVLVAMARFLVASLIWDITATMDLTLMERGNLRKSVNGLFTCGRSLTTKLVQKLQRQNSVTANAVYCHRRGVKSLHPTTENWLRKLYQYSKKNYKSTEDKHETNHINNKYNDTNMNTRKMHNTWACTESA